MASSGDWNLEYDGAAPPLPVTQTGIKRNVTELLPSGAYLLLYDPKIIGAKASQMPRVLCGLVRIQHDPVDDPRLLNTTGSGDLYSCPWDRLAGAPAATTTPLTFKDFVKCISKDIATESKPEKRLKKLHFPRDDYRYYLRLQKLDLERPDKLRVVFATHSYVADREYPWIKGQPITVFITEKRPPDPPDFPAEGYPVANSLGTSIGRAYLITISEKFFRHAILEVHVAQELSPQATSVSTGSDRNSESRDLHSDLGFPSRSRLKRCLKEAKWSIEVVRSKVLPPIKNRWQIEELNQFHEKCITGLAVLKSGIEPWRYHLLIVEKLEGERLGQMYALSEEHDQGLRREGAAIAALQSLKVDGNHVRQLLKNQDAFNWIALHELGHLQGLYHSDELMAPFGHKLTSRPPLHSTMDKRRLMHFPDVWVRPGGVPFGYRYQTAPIEIVDLLSETELLELSVEAPMVAQGDGPRELVMTLRNRSSKRSVLCPYPDDVAPRTDSLGVTHSDVLGATLRTPSGRDNAIWKVQAPRFLAPLQEYPLPAGRSVEYRVPWTKQVGFRQSGRHRLLVHLCWRTKPNRYFRASGEVEFNV